MASIQRAVPSGGFLTNFKNLTTCYLYNITDTQSPYLHTPIFCIRKEVLESAGGFDPRLWRAEDFRLGVVLGSRGYRFIIDRRIKGLHLKEYGFAGALKEDWLRIKDLQSVRLGPGERAFALRAHRWTRLVSLSLPGATCWPWPSPLPDLGRRLFSWPFYSQPSSWRSMRVSCFIAGGREGSFSQSSRLLFFFLKCCGPKLP